MHDSLLLTIRQFMALDSAEEDLVRQLFVPETLPKGSYFLRPGEVSRKVGFVLQGVLHNFQNRDGQDLTYYFGREQRYARFVRTYPDLQQRAPQYYIASYVEGKPQ